MWVMDMCHWVVKVVLRPQKHKGFVLLPKRWVDRSYLWMVILVSAIEALDREGLPATSEAWIYIATIRIMVRRLA